MLQQGIDAGAVQGSDAWKLRRCGSIGASDAPRVVRRTKTGYSADRDSLMAEKVLERLTGVPVEKFKTAAMLQGTEREPEARMLYEMVRGVEVEEVSLVPHPLIQGSHASPDGYIGGTGLIEIKAPQPAAHLDTLLTETISEAHVVQIQWQMACTGRHWCDFVSFNPDFPAAMQLWISRVERDPRFIGELESEIRQFIRELEAKVAKLSRRYAMAA
jgi:predicted phage-related endonuclease